MRKYYFNIQFGHTGDVGNVTREMTIFVTRNEELVKNYEYRELVDEFFNILLKKLENADIKIKSHPKNMMFPKHLTIIINWDDITFYKKRMMYIYDFKDSLNGLSNVNNLDNKEVLKITDDFVFLDDNNRQEEYEKLCEILMYKKDFVYKFPWEGEGITNIEFCKKYASKEFIKKYSHIFHALDFDLL